MFPFNRNRPNQFEDESPLPLAPRDHAPEKLSELERLAMQRLANRVFEERTREAPSAAPPARVSEVAPRPPCFPREKFSNRIYALLRCKREIRTTMLFLEPLRFSGCTLTDAEMMAYMRRAGLFFHERENLYRFCSEADLGSAQEAQEKQLELARVKGERAVTEYYENREKDNAQTRIHDCLQNPADEDAITVLVSDYMLVRIQREGDVFDWVFDLVS
jgi:hypothetical protein